MESADLIPLTGDIAKTTRRAEEFRGLHEVLQKNLQTYLTLTMDALAGVQQKVKALMVADATKQMVCQSLFVSFFFLLVRELSTFPSLKTLDNIRKESRSSMVFGSILKYRMSLDMCSHLARLDVEIAL